MALKHLILLPQGGLANRMRAIASAKRLCRMSGARCSILWDWQDYEALFEPDPAIETIAELPAALARDYSAMRTRLDFEGGSPETWRIPLDGPAGIVLESCHCFSAASDERLMDERSLLRWLPQPSRTVRERAEAFRAEAFPRGPVVGLHMRRTDNKASIRRSPDRLFMRAAVSIARNGGRVFLATDNAKTESAMRKCLGDNLTCFPKNPALMERWPRAFDLAETTADYIDLLLLASCDYVLGSWGSSYSKLAMALNGKPQSHVLLRRWRFLPWG